MSSELATQQLFPGLQAADAEAFLKTLGHEEMEAALDALFDWTKWARPTQLEPPGDWDVWTINAGRGFGKHLQSDIQVPTPTGWVRLGDTTLGQEVLDESGLVTRVTKIFDAMPDQSYRLTFSDGQQLDVCADHQWVTWSHAARKAYLRSQYEASNSEFPDDWPSWRPAREVGRKISITATLFSEATALHRSGVSIREIERRVGIGRHLLSRCFKAGAIPVRKPVIAPDGPGPRVVTTQQIVDSFTYGKRGDLNHCIPLCAPLVLPEADLPIDPYVLGYWLGDGSSNDGGIACAPGDQDNLRAALWQAGFEPTVRSNPILVGTRGLYTHLRKAGLLNNKHVPAAYLRGSIEQRRALLAGLLDSDGYCDKTSGHVEFCNMRRGLAAAVSELATSLGEKPVTGTGRAMLYGTDHGEKYRVTWRPNTNPFRLARKADWVKELGAQGLRNAHRMIVNYERIDREPMRCLTVDSPNSLFLAGRGMIPTHNTKTGAEITNARVKRGEAKSVALVARTPSDVRDTLIEGESGILACSHPNFMPEYEPSKRKLTWPNGAAAHAYTSYEPDQIRGANFDWAWCDEVSSWKYLKDTWDNLMMALRHGRAQCLITTTPKPLKFLRDLYKKESTVVTGGSTYDNAHNLAPSFKRRLIEDYEGTSLGRQELHAELLEQAEGALWQRTWIEENRCAWEDLPPLHKICVAIDPAGAVNKKSSESGIIAAGAGWPQWTRPRIDPVHYYILHDASGRWTPDGWARQGLRQLDFWNGDRLVAEVNFGGDMVKNTVAQISTDAPFSKVTASRGKVIRAEMPVALYEQGRVHHCGTSLGELEDQQCMWEPGDPSPDRLDAAVWAIYWLRSRVGRNLGIVPSQLGIGKRTSPWSF